MKTRNRSQILSKQTKLLVLIIIEEEELSAKMAENQSYALRMGILGEEAVCQDLMGWSTPMVHF